MKIYDLTVRANHLRVLELFQQDARESDMQTGKRFVLICIAQETLVTEYNFAVPPIPLFQLTNGDYLEADAYEDPKRGMLLP